MNDRIRELLGQAKLMAEETINKQISANAELNTFAEKFAGLIIKDCLEITHNLSHLYTNTKVGFDMGYTMGTSRANMEIKKHFGVE